MKWSLLKEKDVPDRSQVTPWVPIGGTIMDKPQAVTHVSHTVRSMLGEVLRIVS
jgi:hypothetical protein